MLSCNIELASHVDLGFQVNEVDKANLEKCLIVGQRICEINLHHSMDIRKESISLT